MVERALTANTPPSEDREERVVCFRCDGEQWCDCVTGDGQIHPCHACNGIGFFERTADVLADVLWLIDCERDAAETTGGKLDAIDNIERRVRGHFALTEESLSKEEERDRRAGSASPVRSASSSESDSLDSTTGAAASETSSTRSSGEVSSRGGPAASEPLDLRGDLPLEEGEPQIGGIRPGPGTGHRPVRCFNCGSPEVDDACRFCDESLSEGRESGLRRTSPTPPSESDFFCRIDIGEVQLFIEDRTLWIYHDTGPFVGEPLEQAIPKLQALLAAARLVENARRIG